MVLSSSGIGFPSAVEETSDVEDGLGWKSGGKEKGSDSRVAFLEGNGAVMGVVPWRGEEEEWRAWDGPERSLEEGFPGSMITSDGASRGRLYICVCTFRTLRESPG